MVTDYRIQHTEENRGVFIYDKDHSRPYTVFKGDIPRICMVCGDEFLARTMRAEYCSGRCSNDAYLARRRLYKQQMRDKVCLVCGDQFTAKRSDNRFCSAKCKQLDYRRRVTANCLDTLTLTGNSNAVTDTC